MNYFRKIKCFLISNLILVHCPSNSIVIDITDYSRRKSIEISRMNRLVLDKIKNLFNSKKIRILIISTNQSSQYLWSTYIDFNDITIKFLDNIIVSQ